MSDPKRWLKASPFGGGLEERLIVAGKRLEPPPGVAERSFSEFSAALVAGQGMAAASGAAQDTAMAGAAQGALSLTGSALAKSFLIGALLGTAVAGSVPAVRSLTHQARFQHGASPAAAVAQPSERAESSAALAPAAAEQAPVSPSPPVAAATPERAAPSRPSHASSHASTGSKAAPTFETRFSAAPPSADPTALDPSLPAPATPPAPSASTAPSPSISPDANQLKLEALALAQASRLLDAGNAAGALSLLSQSRPRSSALVQERDALLVEALMRSGNETSGRESARRFLSAYPDGPLADRVRRWSEVK
jgi:hypothetical protein